MAPRSTVRDKQTAEWIVDIIPRLNAGMNTSIPAELIQDEETPDSLNLTFRDGRVRVDTGYRHFGSYVQAKLIVAVSFGTFLIMDIEDAVEFGYKVEDIVYIQLPGAVTWWESTIVDLTSVPLFGGIVAIIEIADLFSTGLSSTVFRGHQMSGIPKSTFQHQNAAGDVTLLMVTDQTVYKHVTAVDSFHLVSSGVETTLSLDGNGLDITITVVSSAGFVVGRKIGIALDSGEQWQTTVAAVPTGTTIDLTTALPDNVSGIAATSGAKVLQGVALNGLSTDQVVWAAVPSNEWSVFTNGIDVPYKYDATLDTIEVIPNLGSVKCKTLGMVGEAFLLLGNIDEGAGFQPYKLKWSEAGDPTNWTTGLSGDKELLDSRDVIIALKPFATDMIVYRSHSVVQMRFIGQPNSTFSFRPLIFGESVATEGVGPNSPNCVFQLSDRHIIFDSRAVYSYQGGITIENIFENMFAKILGTDGLADDVKLSKSFIQYVKKTDECFIFFADTVATFPNYAVILDLKTDKWRLRKFTHEMTSAASVTDLANLRIRDLIGTIADQAWIIGAGPGSSVAPGLLMTSNSNGQGPPNTGGKGRTYAYDFVTGFEDGTDISWYIHTKRFRRYDRGMRVDFSEIEHQGPEMIISRSKDGGATFTPMGTVPTVLVSTFTRLHEQTVQESFLWKISGVGASAEIGSFVFKHREEARWSL